MNHILVLALVAFASINAATLKADSDGVKAVKFDLLSKKFDQSIINHVITLLDQQTGSGDATIKHADKATILRKLLNRRAKLTQAAEEVQPKLDSKVDLLMKKHENKIAQLKEQIGSPEKFTKLDDFSSMRERIQGVKNFKMPTNVKNPENFRQRIAARLGRSQNVDKKVAEAFNKRDLARSFKVPAHLKLPEKFQRKLNL